MRAKLFSRTGGLEALDVEFGAEATIGRRPGNTLVLADGLVSQQHARVYFDTTGGRFVLEDLESRNGTRLDGLPVTGRRDLVDLHVVTIADTYDLLFQQLTDRADEAPLLAQSAAGGARPAEPRSETPVEPAPPASADAPDAPTRYDPVGAVAPPALDGSATGGHRTVLDRGAPAAPPPLQAPATLRDEQLEAPSLAADRTVLDREALPSTPELRRPDAGRPERSAAPAPTRDETRLGEAATPETPRLSGPGPSSTGRDTVLERHAPSELPVVPVLTGSPTGRPESPAGLSTRLRDAEELRTPSFTPGELPTDPLGLVAPGGGKTDRGEVAPPVVTPALGADPGPRQPPAGSSDTATPGPAGPLLIEVEDHEGTRQFRVDEGQGTLSVGRSPNCVIHSDVRTLSRTHAVIRVEAGHVVVEDLGSSNGTYHDGKRLNAPLRLRPGMVVVFGEEVRVRLVGGS